MSLKNTVITNTMASTSDTIFEEEDDDDVILSELPDAETHNIVSPDNPNDNFVMRTMSTNQIQIILSPGCGTSEGLTEIQIVSGMPPQGVNNKGGNKRLPPLVTNSLSDSSPQQPPLQWSSRDQMKLNNCSECIAISTKKTPVLSGTKRSTKPIVKNYERKGKP